MGIIKIQKLIDFILCTKHRPTQLLSANTFSQYYKVVAIDLQLPRITV